MSVTLQNRKVGQAWLLLCGALAVHVADEALTGFLSVYNPTVLELRDTVPWLPLPVFDFESWLGGLIFAVVALSLLTPFVSQGRGWTRPAAYAFAFLMIGNSIGHTAGTIFGRTVASVQFPRPMPGFYSSPLLLASAILLIARLRTSRHRQTA